MYKKHFNKPHVLNKNAFSKTSYKEITKDEFLKSSGAECAPQKSLEDKTTECSTDNQTCCPQPSKRISHMYLK
ncbi:MAG: hypothetical protein H6850_03650 [Alphaproteobacteria bacterium]|nr:MAG: hypothetical protein H6850_03650 [Alphaproteobacteria bacterium]